MATWIATWEGTDPKHLPKKKLALVLDGRTKEEMVRKMVQVVFASYWYSEGELVAYRQEKNNPYPARFGDLNGVTWTGQITCGHNPHLFARLVDDLKVDSAGNVVWQEKAYSESAFTRGLRYLADTPLLRSSTTNRGGWRGVRADLVATMSRAVAIAEVARLIQLTDAVLG